MTRSTELIHGDCIAILEKMEDNSVDSIVTDPPYGLSFMGKKWDYDVPSVEMWKEAFRVLKPGGHLLSFAGSRTYHRMAVNIEDAGFEIRDQIMWVYGSGFPKSHNIGHKAEEWVGWGSALKPAHEPIVVARKPLIGTIVENVLEHGTGGLNIDGCRIAHDDSDIKRKTFDSPLGMFTNPNREGERGAGPSPEGRFPANFIHDGSDEVVSLFPETGKSAGGRIGNAKGAYSALGETGFTTEHTKGNPGYGDSGSAARFFYCAKASKDERNAGLEHFVDVERTDYGGFHSEEGLITNGRNPANRLPMKNPHPTVKPVALMKYLCRLITPPNGVVLDPFMGSGTTGIAANVEGFNFIGIEREEEYIGIARHRISHWVEIEEQKVRVLRAQRSLFEW